MTEHFNESNTVRQYSPIDNGQYVSERASDTYSHKRKLEDEILALTHAGFGIRLIAYIIDLILISCIKGIIIGPIVGLGGLHDTYFGIRLFSVENILSAIIYFSYFILMTYRFRATLGKMILRLKVLSLKEEKLSIGTVLTRELFGRYISNFFWSLLYLVVLFNPKKRGIHDILSDTFVVREDKEPIRQFILNEGIR